MPAADDPRALQEGWERGVFPRVYLLGGPDHLSKEEAVARLRRAFLGGDADGMNTDVLDGQDASAGRILTAAQTLPFFGGRRLVVVRRADALATAETNRLADGLSAVPDTNGLVLLWDDRVDNRSVLVQAVRGAGAVAVFWPPFENQMPRWIADRAAAQGKKMNAGAARALLEAIGPSLPDLAQEVVKLSLYAQDRPEITAADVEALSRSGRTGFHFMEWERALWNRDAPRALRLLEALRDQGEAAEALWPQLIRAVQRLLTGKALLKERRPRKDVFDRLWIRLRDAQEDFEQAVDRWSWDDLGRGLERLLEADTAVKNGRTDPDAELTRCVVSLVGEKGRG